MGHLTSFTVGHWNISFLTTITGNLAKICQTFRIFVQFFFILLDFLDVHEWFHSKSDQSEYIVLSFVMRKKIKITIRKRGLILGNNLNFNWLVLNFKWNLCISIDDLRISNGKSIFNFQKHILTKAKIVFCKFYVKFHVE